MKYGIGRELLSPRLQFGIEQSLILTLDSLAALELL